MILETNSSTFSAFSFWNGSILTFSFLLIQKISKNCWDFNVSLLRPTMRLLALPFIEFFIVSCQNFHERISSDHEDIRRSTFFLLTIYVYIFNLSWGIVFRHKDVCWACFFIQSSEDYNRIMISCQFSNGSFVVRVTIVVSHQYRSWKEASGLFDYVSDLKHAMWDWYILSTSNTNSNNQHSQFSSDLVFHKEKGKYE